MPKRDSAASISTFSTTAGAISSKSLESKDASLQAIHKTATVETPPKALPINSASSSRSPSPITSQARFRASLSSSVASKSPTTAKPRPSYSRPPNDNDSRKSSTKYANAPRLSSTNRQKLASNSWAKTSTNLRADTTKRRHLLASSKILRHNCARRHNSIHAPFPTGSSTKKRCSKTKKSTIQNQKRRLLRLSTYRARRANTKTKSPSCEAKLPRSTASNCAATHSAKSNSPKHNAKPLAKWRRSTRPSCSSASPELANAR